MSDRTYTAPTKRTRMSQARAARIFASRNGECWHCHHQIRDGERWSIEHPDQLNMGGSDADADLWPIHLTKCRKEKDAMDAAVRAKRNRIVTASYAGKKPSRLRKPEGTEYDWQRGRYVRT